MEPRLRLNIDQLLKQKNLRASDLSKLTGIPKQTISEWRSGLVPKSVVALKRVASAFGVSLDELVFHCQTEAETSPYRPVKSLDPEAILPQRTAVETEPFWFSCDSQTYLRSLSPGLLRELDYSIGFLLERPLSEFVAIDDWPRIQAAINANEASTFSFRMLARDARTISLECQAISLPSYQAVLMVHQQSQRSQAILDSSQAFPSQELLESVLHTYTQEQWQPELQFQLSYEGTSLPWLHTRRQSLARSILSLLHNLSGLAAEQLPVVRSQCEIRGENFGDTLQLRIASPVPTISSEIFDLPKAYAADCGLKWSLREASEGAYPELVLEVPLQLIRN